MAKYNFDVSGSQLIVSLVPVLDDVQPTSMSYLAPSFKIGVGKINAYEYGQPRQSFLFTEIGEINGVEPTDLQDAFDELTTATANFNGGGASPYKVYTALLTQSGTDAPVAIVLENTLGGDVIWSYAGVGLYTLSSPTNVFISNKTCFFVDVVRDLGTFSTSEVLVSYDLITPNSIDITTIDTSNGVHANANAVLNNTTIEIRVYN